MFERLFVSSYKDRFILKGSLLISAILVVSERTTMIPCLKKMVAIRENFDLTAGVCGILSFQSGAMIFIKDWIKILKRDKLNMKIVKI